MAQAPGSEFQQMNYKDWMNRCNCGESEELLTISAMDGVIIATGLTAAVLSVSFPIAAAVVGGIALLIPYLWPALPGVEPGTPQSQISWDKFLRTVESLINETVSSTVRSAAAQRLIGLQNNVNLYVEAACDWKDSPDLISDQERVRTRFRIVDGLFESDMPTFSPENYEIQLLAVYAQAANLHLLLLRDAVKFGTEWGMNSAEVEDYDIRLTRLTSQYTNYCVHWYNEGVNKLKQQAGTTTADWNKVNDFRRDMTIMVLDIVSLWPTYNPTLYAVPTKSQLTRQVYTPMFGEGLDFFDKVDNAVIAPPSLFRWLRKVTFFRRELSHTGEDRAYTQYSGYQMTLQTTLNSTSQETPVVGHISDIEDILNIGQEPNVEVYKMSNIRMAYTPGKNMWQAPQTFDFHFTPSGTVERVGIDYAGIDGLATYNVNQGLVCKNNINEPCDPCTTPCNIGIVNTSDPCDSLSLYSGRLSWIGLSNASPQTLIQTTYGWTHVSADATNTIDAEKITQIPAVKAYQLNNGSVIKGPGSTGGDLVELPVDSNLQMKVTHLPSDAISGYRMRIRYAASQPAIISVGFASNFGEIVNSFELPATYSGGSLTYNTFGYKETITIPIQQVEYIGFVGFFSTNTTIVLDKIEFIPIQGSVAEYEANQNLEKARKAVNALFTNDAKNALQLKVTDYLVDQAAKLVECMSDEIYPKEKMCLLDLVKVAKRLSQARNLLHHGDFESSDWSGENGWKTSNHVSVTSGNPIFKGRYLHMPGAGNTQFSDQVFPT
ncbi:insecticidal delta-endotoxin Cry8Ea1 family protein, partial [Bacillus mycoides]|uniref:insecticidal delta-endotoxin Cry8Ea1 family protein n=1 Tax=Bacillus mycoides TaxID=1405 RepID=UPI001F1E85E9